MLGLAFSVDVLYIILNIYLITDTLASTGNMIANDSVNKKDTSSELMKVSEKSNQHKQYAVELVEKNNII